MYSQITNQIRVSVEPTYLESQSSPLDHEYVWAYQVRIENTGDRTVQLKTRRWRIIDAAGRIFTVEGKGVVGEEPVLAPGDSFEYVSGTPLATPSGMMQGSYGMLAGDEATGGHELFEATIPTFSLDSPHDRQLPN